MILGIRIAPPDIAVLTGRITGLQWTRTIEIKKETQLNESDWTLPEGATMPEEKEEIHHCNDVVDHDEDKEVQPSRQVIDHYDTQYMYEDNGDGTFTGAAMAVPVYKTEYYYKTEQQPVYIALRIKYFEICDLLKVTDRLLHEGLTATAD